MLNKYDNKVPLIKLTAVIPVDAHPLPLQHICA
jgi:hypothetical protein